MLDTSSVPTEQFEQWLDDVEPVWPSFGRENIAGLIYPFPFSGERVSISNEPFDEIDNSPLLKGAKQFLAKAMVSPGIKLTATGNLNRKFVDEMIDILNWEMYTRDKLYRICKVVNEIDFFPLHYLHILLKESSLLRNYKGHVIASKLGKALLQDVRGADLFSLLITTLYEKINICYFDRMPFEGWPNTQVGLILYGLKVIADDWTSEETLMKKTAIPDERIFKTPYDFSSTAYHARILRPLEWFGLMEHRVVIEAKTNKETTEYKKSKAFDRVFAFNLSLPKIVRFVQ
jgi:hypothetical protein